MAIAKRVLGLGVGTLVALLACEVAFRALGIAPPERQESYSSPEHYLGEKNRLKYHDVEWRRRKEPGIYRVIALGDSFTMGRRVPLEDLFVKRVERSLNERSQVADAADEGSGSAPARRYEVLNMSHQGWDTRDELDALRREGLPFAPDAVVVFFYVNDATGLDSNPIVVRKMHEEVHVRDGWLNRISQAYDYLDYRLRRSRVSRETIASYRSSFFDEGEAQEQWRESRAALAELAELARAEDFALGLVVFPMLVRLDETHELADIYALVLEECRALGIPAMSLLSTFSGYEAEELWVNPKNAHPNSVANGIAAPAIEAFLIDAGIVPDPGSQDAKDVQGAPGE